MGNSRWHWFAGGVVLGLLFGGGVAGSYCMTKVATAEKARVEAEDKMKECEMSLKLMMHEVYKTPQTHTRLPLEAPPPGEEKIHAALTTLLKERATEDPQHTSLFFTTLAGLARKHGRKPQEYFPDRFVEEGRAALVRDGQRSYIVAVLRGCDAFIPGRDTQYLLLLDVEGRLLDRLSCDVSNRLTRMFDIPGCDFRTDVLKTTERDGAQLVVRYIPGKDERIAGNWSHGIDHGGKPRGYVWDNGQPGAIPSVEWEKKGLCRVAVRDGKFAVVFPKPD